MAKMKIKIMLFSLFFVFYLVQSKVKLATLVEGYPNAPFWQFLHQRVGEGATLFFNCSTLSLIRTL